MPKTLIAALLALFLALPLFAQDSEDDEGAVAETGEAAVAEASGEGAVVEPGEVAVAEASDEADEIDLDNPEDADLDEQTYEEDEDDFISSEEIPTDEPVAFPANI